MSHKVVIIGGGASGMMAAITSAKQGNKVTIVEHMDRPGKKILMTGNGKCNYSNVYQDISCYRSSDEIFVKNVLKQFSQPDATSFFELLGIISKDKNGYLYPNSGQAAVILDALRLKCNSMNIKIACNTECYKVEKQDNIWNVFCKTVPEGKNWNYEADSVIISTGGKTYKKTGSDGSGYMILKNLGHKIIKPLPALTALYCKGDFMKNWKGVRADGKIQLFVEGKAITDDIGELQLTDYGISGIPVFQVSRYASRAIYNHKNVEAVVDFMPKIKEDNLLKHINNAEGWISVALLLNGMINKKLTEVILKKCKIKETTKIKDLDEKQKQKIISGIKHFKLDVTGTGSFEQAQVCTGGADISQINAATMESKINKGIFITGEVMDVDAVCGGYNLQWAWSTGYIAGVNS